MATRHTRDSSRRNRRQCERNKEELEKEIEDNFIEVKFDDIAFFSHATNKECKDAIERSGCLKKKTTLLIKNKELYGVSFCPTLFDGRVPTQSPHGNKQIRIPIEHFLSGNPHLFYNTYNIVDGIHYVMLVLVKESDCDEFSFCKKNLVELPMEDNYFLMIDRSEKRYECFSNSSCYHQFKIWVDVFVIGDVELPKSAFWEDIKCTGKYKRRV